MDSYNLVYDFATRSPSIFSFTPIFFMAGVGLFVTLKEWKEIKLGRESGEIPEAQPSSWKQILFNSAKDYKDKPQAKPTNIRLVFFSVWTLFASLTALGGVYSQLSSFNYLKEIYEKKSFTIVEGKVEKFVPIPERKKGGREKFDVNNVHFEYTQVDTTSYGYHSTGRIKEGEFVRIGYINYQDNNLILKLEIKN